MHKLSQCCIFIRPLGRSVGRTCALHFTFSTSSSPCGIIVVYECFCCWSFQRHQPSKSSLLFPLSCFFVSSLTFCLCCGRSLVSLIIHNFRVSAWRRLNVFWITIYRYFICRLKVAIFAWLYRIRVHERDWLKNECAEESEHSWLYVCVYGLYVMLCWFVSSYT